MRQRTAITLAVCLVILTALILGTQLRTASNSGMMGRSSAALTDRTYHHEPPRSSVTAADQDRPHNLTDLCRPFCNAQTGHENAPCALGEQREVAAASAAEHAPPCTCVCPPPPECPESPPPPQQPPASPAPASLFTMDRYQHVLSELYWITGMMPQDAEGGSFVYSVSTHTLFRMATALKPGSVYCESGFNGGHSAVTVLAANPDVTVLSIDLLSHPYSKIIGDAVSAKYGSRFKLIQRNVLTELASPQHMNQLCDFIFSDAHVKNAGRNLFDQEVALWVPHAAAKSILMFESGIQYVADHPVQFAGPHGIFQSLISSQTIIPLRMIQSTLPSLFQFPAPTGMAIWLYSIGSQRFTDAEIAMMTF